MEFVNEKSEQSLGLGSKLLKTYQVCLYMVSTLNSFDSCDKVVSQLSSRECTGHVGDSSLLLGEQRGKGFRLALAIL